MDPCRARGAPGVSFVSNEAPPSRAMSGRGITSRLLQAHGASNLADGMTVVLFQLAAKDLTEMAALSGLVLFVLRVSPIVVSFRVGALLTQHSPTRIAQIASLLRVAAFLGLAVLFLVASSTPIVLVVGLILAAAVAGATEEAFDGSVQVLPPRIYGNEGRQLDRVNGWIQAVEGATNDLGGRLIGGLLYGLGAMVSGFTAAGLYLLSAIRMPFVAGLRVSESEEPRTMIREAVRATRRDATLLVLLSIGIVVNLGLAAEEAFLAFYAEQQLQIPEASFGILPASLGLGALLGAWLSPAVNEKLGTRATLALCAATVPIQFMVKVLSPFWGEPNQSITLLAFLCANVIQGAGVTALNVVSLSLRQQLTEERLLGSLNALFRMSFRGALAVGAVGGGVLATLIGVGRSYVVLLLGGLVLLVAALLAVVALRKKTSEESGPKDDRGRAI